jgi:hypothetical protein
MLKLAKDHSYPADSKRYFVYQGIDEVSTDGAIIYAGTYIQCLIVLGAFLVNPDTTIDQIIEENSNIL